jgi:hypothetical protein
MLDIAREIAPIKAAPAFKRNIAQCGDALDLLRSLPDCIMSIGLAVVLVAIMGFAIYSLGFRRAVLIVVAVIAGGIALLIYNSSTRDYRECVALMWERKHPVQVKQRYLEQAAGKCEKDRLSGADPACDPNKVFSECERLVRENHLVQMTKCIEDGSWNAFMADGGGPPPDNPCQHLSLEKLRRVDAEASATSRRDNWLHSGLPSRAAHYFTRPVAPSALVICKRRLG